MSLTKARKTRAAARGLRTLELTAAYCPAAEGGFTVAILDARGVYSQGDTFDEARRNLHAVVALMLEEAPSQFGIKAASPPPGALLEKLFVSPDGCTQRT